MSEATKCPFGYDEYDEEPTLIEDELLLTEEEQWARFKVPDAESEQDDYKPSVSENIPDFQKLRGALAIICPVASELGGLREISEAVRDIHKQS